MNDPIERLRGHVRCALVLACSALALVACSESDDGPPAGTSFTTFVEDLVADTAEDTEPVEIDGVDFVFSDDENAFDSLFP
ncbi:MAG: hypothetical protein R3F34_04235 [Planctomycetota bacterium]